MGYFILARECWRAGFKKSGEIIIHCIAFNLFIYIFFFENNICLAHRKIIDVGRLGINQSKATSIEMNIRLPQIHKYVTTHSNLFGNYKSEWITSSQWKGEFYVSSSFERIGWTLQRVTLINSIRSLFYIIFKTVWHDDSFLQIWDKGIIFEFSAEDSEMKASDICIHLSLVYSADNILHTITLGQFMFYMKN